ncbi:MAG TPA: GNAT family N-acetyltransferase [Advenella sp.]|nr:GNAT family N-acetyltransferase [Advenella sp.]
MPQPSVQIQYRRLLPGEVALLRQLNLLFSRAFDDPASYESKPATDAYLMDFLAKDHVSVFVAVNDGRVLGGLVAYALDKFEMARREYYIYDLAVDAGHRRRGIATALIRHLCEFAADNAGWVVYVQADRGDEAAIALYNKLGMKEHVLHFDIQVPLQQRADDIDA